jgi:ATP-binding cassette subfamily B protein
VALRPIEPLGAPVEVPASARDDGAAEASTNAKGTALQFDAVSVQPAGHPVLEDVNLLVDPGMHLAIVGPSGAGKTSLLGVLLGWQHPASGRVLVDGEELNASVVMRTRQQTAWVDPTIQLWNRQMLENVAYGAEPCKRPALGAVVDSAELRPLLERLPAGFATSLGEDGGLVSGGEGQRVRLARAFLRREARLVLLDEPFRGLERATRTRLLLRARSWWKRATLLCVTHDVSATRDFDRVVVLENGRVVECGAPDDLASSADSRYARLLAAEEAVRDQVWGAAEWRRVHLEDGALVDREPPP